MKIFPVEKVREADQHTIINEPIASIDLMERAALQLNKWITKNISKKHHIIVFAGLGNNGGDGLALSRMLSEKKYNVCVHIIKYSDNTSVDFDKNLVRLKNNTEVKIVNISNVKDIPKINSTDIVIDAIFGSGLTRPATGIAGEAIKIINESGAIIIAVDVPSGLFVDSNSTSSKGEIIRADYTLTFQFPKLAFLLPENEFYVGNWHVLNIGLSPEYINKEKTQHFYMLRQDIQQSLKKRHKFSHKGTFGHALIIAGSYGKIGAAVLASRACLRSGVGLLHTHVPKCGINIMQTASPETMLSIDRYDNYFSQLPVLDKFNVIGIGPGLGTEHQSQMAFKMLIQEASIPMVIDADALNILAENPTWISFLPSGSVLTPHPGEFRRLAGQWVNDFDRLDKQKQLSQKFGVVIVLKGAFTSVSFPDGKIYFNSTGNPGMATAGSGDVLTGIITGLIASGYTSGVAAVLGVYLHGLAGDIAAKKTGYEALIANDIVDNIGKAFKKLTS